MACPLKRMKLESLFSGSLRPRQAAGRHDSAHVLPVPVPVPPAAGSWQRQQQQQQPGGEGCLSHAPRASLVSLLIFVPLGACILMAATPSTKSGLGATSRPFPVKSETSVSLGGVGHASCRRVRAFASPLLALAVVLRGAAGRCGATDIIGGRQGKEGIFNIGVINRCEKITLIPKCGF